MTTAPDAKRPGLSKIMFEQLQQDLEDLRAETSARSWIMQLKALRTVFEMNPTLQEVNNLGLTSYTRKGGRRIWLDDARRNMIPKGLSEFDKAIEAADYVYNSAIEGIWRRDEDWMKYPEWDAYQAYNFRVLEDNNQLGAGIKAGMVFKCIGYNNTDHTVTLEYREGAYLSSPMNKVQITEAEAAFAPAPEKPGAKA